MMMMMVEKTDKDPATEACQKPHNLKEHRLDFLESLLFDIYPEIVTEHLKSSCYWKCCGQEISPADWPLLVKSGIKGSNKSVPSTAPIRSSSVIQHTSFAVKTHSLQSTTRVTSSPSENVDVVVPQSSTNVNNGEDITKPSATTQQQHEGEENDGGHEQTMVIFQSSDVEDVEQHSEKNCTSSPPPAIEINKSSKTPLHWNWKKWRAASSSISAPSPKPLAGSSASMNFTLVDELRGTGSTGQIPMRDSVSTTDDVITGKKSAIKVNKSSSPPPPPSRHQLKKISPYKNSRQRTEMSNEQDSDDSPLNWSTEEEEADANIDPTQISDVQDSQPAADCGPCTIDLAAHDSDSGGDCSKEQQSLSPVFIFNISPGSNATVPAGPSSSGSGCSVNSSTEPIIENVSTSDTSNSSEGRLQDRDVTDVEEATKNGGVTHGQEITCQNNSHSQAELISAAESLLNMTSAIVSSQSTINAATTVTTHNMTAESSALGCEESSLPLPDHSPPRLEGSVECNAKFNEYRKLMDSVTSGKDEDANNKLPNSSLSDQDDSDDGSHHNGDGQVPVHHASVSVPSSSSKGNLLQQVEQVHHQLDTNLLDAHQSAAQSENLNVQADYDPNAPLSDYMMNDPRASTKRFNLEHEATHVDSNDERERDEQSDDETGHLRRRRSVRKRKKSEKMQSLEAESDSNDDIDDDEPMQADAAIVQSNLGPTIDEPPASNVERLSGRNASGNSKKKGSAVRCPYCGRGVSRNHRFPHLETCQEVTLEQRKHERKNKGTITWEAAPCIDYSKNHRKRGRPSRTHAAVTDTEGGSRRRRGASTSALRGTVTDFYSSNDEEPLKKKRARSSSGRGFISRNDQLSKSVKKNASPVAGSSNEINYPSMPCEPEVINLDETDDDEDDDGQVGRTCILQQRPPTPAANLSVSIDLLSELEDLDTTGVISIPSAPGSQVSSTMTATTALSCTASTSDLHHRNRKTRKSASAICSRCGKRRTLWYMPHHQRGKGCIPTATPSAGAATDYESQEEMEDEQQLEPQPTRRRRSRHRSSGGKQGNCPYCGKEMLRSSVRNHVLNKVCPEVKAAQERGQTLGYHSQAEDSQTEDDEQEVVVSTGNKRNSGGGGAGTTAKVDCQDCGQVMLKTSLYNHRKNACKGRPAVNKMPATPAHLLHQQYEDISDDEGYLRRKRKTRYNNNNNTYNNKNVDEDDDESTEPVNDSHYDRVASDPQRVDMAEFNGDDFICPYEDCDFWPEDRREYEMHLDQHSGDSQHLCPNPKCNKIFCQNRNLPRHETTHLRHYYEDCTGISYKSPSLQPKLILYQIQK